MYLKKNTDSVTEMVGLSCRVGAHNSRYAHDTRLYPLIIAALKMSQILSCGSKRPGCL